MQTMYTMYVTEYQPVGVTGLTSGGGWSMFVIGELNWLVLYAPVYEEKRTKIDFDMLFDVHDLERTVVVYVWKSVVGVE